MPFIKYPWSTWHTIFSTDGEFCGSVSVFSSQETSRLRLWTRLFLGCWVDIYQDPLHAHLLSFWLAKRIWLKWLEYQHRFHFLCCVSVRHKGTILILWNFFFNLAMIVCSIRHFWIMHKISLFDRTRQLDRYHQDQTTNLRNDTDGIWANFLVHPWNSFFFGHCVQDTKPGGTPYM